MTPYISRRSRRRGIWGASLALLLLALIISSSVLAEDIRYVNQSQRDPFTPLVGPEGVVNARSFDASGINVEGIIYDPNGESLVLINGEFYKEGDHVNGANVITIFRDRVVLGQSDEEKTIWIREELVNPGENTNARTPEPKKTPEKQKKLSQS